MSFVKKQEVTLEEIYAGKTAIANQFLGAVYDQQDQLEAENKDTEEEDGGDFHSCTICQDLLAGNLLSLSCDEGINHLQQLADAYKIPIKIVIKKSKKTFIFR